MLHAHPPSAYWKNSNVAEGGNRDRGLFQDVRENREDRLIPRSHPPPKIGKGEKLAYLRRGSMRIAQWTAIVKVHKNIPPTATYLVEEIVG